jgi:hypothetical protein
VFRRPADLGSSALCLGIIFAVSNGPGLEVTREGQEQHERHDEAGELHQQLHAYHAADQLRRHGVTS